MVAVSDSLFDSFGGDEFFTKLVEGFYERVALDTTLSALYPEAPDFSGASERLKLFLMQYWGGPNTYSESRGHPRLRMRHSPFKVNPDARDRWLAAMRASLDDLKLPPLDDEMLWDYLQRAAFSLVNTFED